MTARHCPVCQQGVGTDGRCLNCGEQVFKPEATHRFRAQDLRPQVDPYIISYGGGDILRVDPLFRDKSPHRTRKGAKNRAPR